MQKIFEESTAIDHSKPIPIQLNNEHWDTFKRISMDVTSLSSSEKDIQTIIGKINKGFATCNFVGVIQRIEMKMEEAVTEW